MKPFEFIKILSCIKWPKPAKVLPKEPEIKEPKPAKHPAMTAPIKRKKATNKAKTATRRPKK